LNRLLLTPFILAVVGCAALGDAEPPVSPLPMPTDLVEAINPPPPLPAPVPVRRRAGRTGYSMTIDATLVYEYESDRIYPVTVTPGRGTVLQLGSGEQLSRQPIIGDPDNLKWLVEATRGADDFVIVRCASIGAVTNLFITTGFSDYQVDLACKRKGGRDRVRWHRQEAPRGDYAAGAAQIQRQVTFDPNTFSRKFEITNPSGDKPVWQPINVYERAGRSYIEFPPNLGPIKTAPVLYEKGGNSIPFRITGNRFYEVDKALLDAELRLDSSVVRIKRIG